MTHIALVLGNGFDLDLGLPTKYSDFADPKNKEWYDFLNMTGTIIKQCYRTEFVNHMEQAREHELWFDIEKEIGCFAERHRNLSQEQIGLIRYQFETLVESLRLYIGRVAVQKNKKDESLAESLLRKLNSIQHTVAVYTYNYTDCFTICGIVKKDNVKMHHVHGSLSYNMTLGCRVYDENKENHQLDFMYKPTVDLQKDILKQNLTLATEVIVFGHSLNDMDYCYFKEFFDAVESGHHICKHLTIICKDAKSEKQIIENLKKNVCVETIKNHIDINFIYTDLWYNNDMATMKKYETLCNRIN